MPAQVIGTGPTVRFSAMQEVFQSLLFAARREIVVTTPYYVPDDSLQIGALRQPPFAASNDRSSSRRATIPGSWAGRAAATTPTCSRPA